MCTVANRLSPCMSTCTVGRGASGGLAGAWFFLPEYAHNNKLSGNLHSIK